MDRFLARHEVPIITVIFNNRSYNETRNRMWSRGKNQREKKLDMISHLGNPDVNFAKIAEILNRDGDTSTTNVTVRKWVRDGLEAFFDEGNRTAARKTIRKAV